MLVVLRQRVAMPNRLPCVIGPLTRLRFYPDCNESDEYVVGIGKRNAGAKIFGSDAAE